jgi:hypothetical protein
MTVKELIEELKTYDQNKRVVVDGYEGGYDDISPLHIKDIELCLFYYSEGYYGDHGEWDSDLIDETLHTRAEAVLIARYPVKEGGE